MRERTVVPIILAAGKGTRMDSDLAKVLHLLDGKALIDHVLDALASVSVAGVSVLRPVVVVGWQAEQVQTAIGDRCAYALQEEQLGTGHAVLSAQPVVDRLYPGSHSILVCCGDTPLIRSESLLALMVKHVKTDATITLLTAQAETSSDFGRIVRDGQRRVQAIVEWKNATEEQRRIREVNTGVYCISRSWLWGELPRLARNKESGEYYLTDLFNVAWVRGRRIETVEGSVLEGTGVNTPSQLATLEEILRRRKSE